MLAAIGLGQPAAVRAPVYDATGAMMEAIQAPVTEQSNSDAPGIRLIVLPPREPRYLPLPVYDATAAMLAALP